jgi:hypothetical protein
LTVLDTIYGLTNLSEAKCQVSEFENETEEAVIKISRSKNQAEAKGVVINFSGLEPKKSVEIKCQVICLEKGKECRCPICYQTLI